MNTINTTTMTIDRTSIREYEAHKFEAEASSLQIPPGRWPTKLQVKESFGNGQPLKLTKVNRSWGEIESMVYVQIYGCVELTVYND